MLLQTAAESADAISTIADLGMLGALLIGAGLAVYLIRSGNGRNGKASTPANGLLEVARMQQGAITAMVADQATITATQAQIVEGQRVVAENMTRLVEVHNKSESTIGRLELLMEKLESDRIARAR